MKSLSCCAESPGPLTRSSGAEGEMLKPTWVMVREVWECVRGMDKLFKVQSLEQRRGKQILLPFASLAILKMGGSFRIKLE